MSRARPVQFILYRGDEEIILPTKKAVCHGCSGKGTHVNRAIDGNGLTQEDFDADPDFEESYFRGDYDVRCETCHGANVVDEIDEDRCKPGDYEAYCKQEDDAAREDASEAWLRRAESGERW